MPLLEPMLGQYQVVFTFHPDISCLLSPQFHPLNTHPASPLRLSCSKSRNMDNKVFEANSIALDGNDPSDYAHGADGKYSRDELDMIQQGKTQRFHVSSSTIDLGLH